ncbi:MAG: 23S rRNA (uracil-5-)-methyltransferase RumA, partial [Lachnospiraceae bacterium]|nr:23S rRNA (uracil-5-)-methyltransferase RumA [Lachnospiraceae bacterium]
MLTKGDLFAETIVDLTSEGLGVAKTNTEDGRLYPVFVKDTAIGDRIEGIITKTSKTFAYGKMLKLLKESKDRTVPKCENAKRCGGCSIQHISYKAQLEWKEKFVEETLCRIGGISKDKYIFNNIIPSEYN